MTDQMLASEPGHRAEIALSWHRAALNGLKPEASLDGLSQVDIDRQSRLLVAAAPVLDEVAEQLADSRICVVLADGDARIVDRRVGNPALTTLLDRISAVPGTVYDEASTGTNSIATPIELRHGFSVLGEEHFLESLKGFSCYGHPIIHPVTRRLEGVIDITAAANDVSELFAPFLIRAAHEIEERLLQGSRAAQQHLLSSYQVAATRTTDPVIVVGEGVTLANETALDQLGPTDFVVIRSLADELGRSRRLATRILLASGALTDVAIESIERSGGALIRLKAADRYLLSVAAPLPVVPRKARAAPPRRAVDALPAELALVLVTGEPGTGRSTTARDQAGRQAVAFDGLSVSDLGVAEWTSRLATHLAAGDSVILDDLHLLPDATASRVRHLLLSTTRPGQVVATSAPVATLTGEQAALASVFLTHVDLPTLRSDRASVPALMTALLEDAIPGTRISLSPKLIETLVNHSWPGNLHELKAIAHHLAATTHSGALTPADLPTAYQVSSTHRPRTPLEQSEYDTIVAALRACGGNKVKAARQLGIARATLYSRIRQFRIGV